MKRKQLLILIIVLPVLALMAAPGAQAADCGAAPAVGVDWSSCDKSGLDLSGANLSLANLTGTDFTGTILSGANMTLATVNGTDFTNANLNGANLSFITNLDDAIFVDANVNGVEFAFTTVRRADFSGANGVPILNSTSMFDSTCPLGDASTEFPPFCTWEAPNALSLAGINAAALVSFWPWLLAGLLLAGTAVLLLVRRDREAVAA